ncbi:MAG: hypothetical protein IJI35_00410 [Kiritimatiellae bacterium]|nr:hypothetical protein [Kiritimatiellia bacterium]
MKKDTFERNKSWLALVGAVCVFAVSAAAVQHFYCKYCGHKTTSVNSLTASLCQRHPNGPAKDRHALYEGGEKES